MPAQVSRIQINTFHVGRWRNERVTSSGFTKKGALYMANCGLSYDIYGQALQERKMAYWYPNRRKSWVFYAVLRMLKQKW